MPTPRGFETQEDIQAQRNTQKEREKRKDAIAQALRAADELKRDALDEIVIPILQEFCEAYGANVHVVEHAFLGFELRGRSIPGWDFVRPFTRVSVNNVYPPVLRYTDIGFEPEQECLIVYYQVSTMNVPLNVIHLGKVLANATRLTTKFYVESIVGPQHIKTWRPSLFTRLRQPGMSSLSKSHKTGLFNKVKSLF